MKPLIVNQNDVYQVDNRLYFKFTIGNKIHRDIPCELTKIDRYMLEIICKFCELDYKGLKKSQLVELIANSNCLIMNQNNN